MKSHRMITMSMSVTLRLFTLLALLSITALSALAQCAAIDRTVTVFESAGLVSTGITINRGDTVVLTASGSIWAGVVATGQNGPEGWADLRTAGTEFPLPGARIYSLLGKIGGDPLFYVGQGTLFSASSSGPLFLRTNDNVPGGGNGQFTCRIQVYRQTTLNLEERSFTVRKNDRNVRTGVTINDGDRIFFDASSRIWSGVILTGDTGPDGWEDLADNSNFPLPGAPKWGLLARIGGGRPFYIGQFNEIRHSGAPGQLSLLINDDNPTSGGGQFISRVRIQRAGSPLNAMFSGTATLTIDNKNTPDPFVETLKGLPVVFSQDRCAVSLVDLPPIVRTFPVPGGKNTATLSRSSGGSGAFDRNSGRMVIPITLRLTNSHPFGGVSDLSLTLTTDAPGGRAFVNGSVTLVGSGRFVGGFLGGSNATLVVTGSISPMP
ncbi:MAG TPA: hypothetical protein VJ810_21795 [Blastocatellia bacterium]|nr:hypothetical protein [Blastocatellia bacterium]